MRVDGREDLTQHVPQAVHLIDEIENDWDSLVIDPELLQIFDQLRSREIDLRKAAIACVLARHEPTRPQPMIQRFDIDPCLQDKFAGVHGYTSIAWRGL
jgi:hypothetical protein